MASVSRPPRASEKQGVSDPSHSGTARNASTASLPTPGTEDLSLVDGRCVTPPRVPARSRKRAIQDPDDSIAASALPSRPPVRKRPRRSGATGEGPSRVPVDSPGNPFLAREGEKTRRPGAFRDEAGRKITYVFRGKRIHYDAPEGIVLPGESPFVDSVPRLLFPRAPSPSPGPSMASTSAQPITPDLTDDWIMRTPVKNAMPRRYLPTPQSNRKGSAQIVGGTHVG